MRRLTVVLGLVAVLCGLVATPALATPPSGLSGAITDPAGVLSSSDRSHVESAIEELRQQKGTNLFVAFVPDFSGVSGDQWAAQAGQAAGLGDRDVLLAVATTARQYGYHAGRAESTGTVGSVISGDVVPKLRNGDWAGAGVALADGLRTGRADAGSSGSGSGLATLVVVLVLVAALGGGYLFFRSRRRRRALEQEQAAALPTGPRPPADPYAGTPTDQLNGRASTALLDLDEKVRTAQVDLDYARSYYGEDAVPGTGRPWRRRRRTSPGRSSSGRSSTTTSPRTSRRPAGCWASCCSAPVHADQVLTAQATAVDQLRQRERDVPRRAGRARAASTPSRQRLPQEQRRMAGLAQRYAPAALSAVGDNVGQAGVRLVGRRAGAAAGAAGRAGRQHRAGGRHAAARGARRVGQSATLLDAVQRLEADLPRRAAPRRRPGGDRGRPRRGPLAGGRGDRGGLQAQIARTEAALAGVDTGARPSGDALPDPLGALRRLEEAAGGLRAGPAAPPGTRPPRPARPPRRSTRCCSAPARRSRRPVTSSAPAAAPSAARPAPGWPRPSATSTPPPGGPPATR